MVRAVLLALGFVACGGGESAPTTAPKATAIAVKPVAAPAAAEIVGPDGPESIKVPAVSTIPADEATILSGQKVWDGRGCGGCHKYGEKLVGPDMQGLLSRRSVPWVERMILFPEEMTKRDPEAKKLLGQLMVQMPKQGVTEAEIVPLLAYIKSKGG